MIVSPGDWIKTFIDRSLYLPFTRRRLLASGWLSRNRSKLVQALRMTASSLATFALAEALGLPQEFWAVITALKSS